MCLGHLLVRVTFATIPAQFRTSRMDLSVELLGRIQLCMPENSVRRKYYCVQWLVQVKRNWKLHGLSMYVHALSKSAARNKPVAVGITHSQKLLYGVSLVSALVRKSTSYLAYVAAALINPIQRYTRRQGSHHFSGICTIYNRMLLHQSMSKI